jgi:hypothetical protein
LKEIKANHDERCGSQPDYYRLRLHREGG